jgi:hypothetical protein
MEEGKMPDENTPLYIDTWLRRFRELVTAALAGVICLGTMVMVAIAFANVGNQETFARAKDLLLFLNPMVGLVIGYYFSKVSSEGRAESAEASAFAATASAQQAVEARSRAEAEAGVVRQQAQVAVEDMVQASERMLAQAPARSPGVLGGDNGNAPLNDGYQALQDAAARARRLLN